MTRPGMNTRLLTQVFSQSLGGPVRGFHTNLMRIYLNDSQEFGFPGDGDPPLSTRGGTSWNGIQSTSQKALEHTYDGILAAQDGLGYLT